LSEECGILWKKFEICLKIWPFLRRIAALCRKGEKGKKEGELKIKNKK
jgi:hypothetical protein